jgi:DNA-binding MarR family transcriptional regulator
MDALRIHTLLERLGSLVRADLRRAASQRGVALAQLEALHYLAICNRYSDTPAGVAEFLGATKGTTSQTLRTLAQKGLIDKHADAADARKIHCALTDAGRALVAETLPAPLLAEAFPQPSDPNDIEAAHLAAALTALLRRIQQRHALRTFGQCGTCTHFRHVEDGFRCGLTSEPLSQSDSQLICREHTPPAPPDVSQSAPDVTQTAPS